MSDLDLDPGPAPSSWRERVELLTTTTPSARQALGALALVAVLGVVAWTLLLRPPSGPPVEAALPLASSASVVSSTTVTTAATEVVAHAAGAVASPGVYRLAPGARVADLLDAAGGPLPHADVDQLNLAAVVADGERVYVPRVGEVVPVVASSGGDAPAGPLDLNTATVEQLEALPGIGPATAEAIVSARDERGGFRSIDDLLDVRGIGPAKLDAIRELVTVS
ncbi:MAG TPA: helix-hairpin-helix domain-containing protein [Acidimicrobiales bacterium]|nr:helix-hairpin-helix domain-containing protein [Acidimicrobiales bacterium]